MTIDYNNLKSGNIHFIDNILPLELIKRIKNCIDTDLQTKNYINSKTYNDKYFTNDNENIYIILLHNTERYSEHNDLYNNILTVLGEKLNLKIYENDELQLYINILNEGSYIPVHDDSGYSLTFTIYLNENYDEKNGGLFSYSQLGDNILMIPKFNKMVMLNNVEHSVTKVNFEKRYSIQGFLKRNIKTDILSITKIINLSLIDKSTVRWLINEVIEYIKCNDIKYNDISEYKISVNKMNPIILRFLLVIFKEKISKILNNYLQYEKKSISIEDIFFTTNLKSNMNNDFIYACIFLSNINGGDLIIYKDFNKSEINNYQDDQTLFIIFVCK